MKGKWFKIIVFMLSLFCLLILPGCNKKKSSGSFIIAEQYGLAYAPLQVIKEKKLLEELLPGTEIRWVQLGNTAAIREAMLSGNADAGFMGIPPFIIAYDKGMDWKIATGLCRAPLGLVVNRDSLKSLKDFTDKDKIALPQPGSIQHILLSMACERVYGNPKALDNNLVTLNHPDGMSALLTKSGVSAHFTALPYLAKELKTEGMTLILSGEEAMGEAFSFIVGVTPKRTYGDKREYHDALVKAVALAVEYLETDKSAAAALLAPLYGLSVPETLEYLSYPEQEYTTRILGLSRFIEFMGKAGYTAGGPYTPEELVWD